MYFKSHFSRTNLISRRLANAFHAQLVQLELLDRLEPEQRRNQLDQWVVLAAPHSLLQALAQVEYGAGQETVVAAQCHVKEGAHETRRVLGKF